MDNWHELCNLRTTLLHLQFLRGSLQEQISKQTRLATRAHQDRFLQYCDMHAEYSTLRLSNFQKILIVKVENCLAAYANDQKMWALLDGLLAYVRMIQQQQIQHVCKLYVGADVLFDFQKVQARLIDIQTKLNHFIAHSIPTLQRYSQQRLQVISLRESFLEYLKEVQGFNQQVKKKYSEYIRELLRKREQKGKERIRSLREQILG